MSRGWFACVAAAAFAAAAAPAHAQVMAQVAPVKASFTVRPGERAEQDVTFANLGTVALVVRPKWSDLTVSEDGTLDLVAPGSTPASLAGSVTFTPREFSLRPGETGHIHVTLQLPAEGPPTRWGVLLSETRPAELEPTRLGSRVVTNFGTTFYLSRIPADRIQAEITELVAAPLGGDSLVVLARARNAGERHLYLTGEMTISDSTGAVTTRQAIPMGVVLPGASRRYAWTCSERMPPGRYRVSARFETGEPELLVGETWIDWRAQAFPAPIVADHDTR